MSNKIVRSFTQNDFKKETLLAALSFKGNPQKELFQLARERRSHYFPSEEVEVRSVIELSNICQQECNFCNINLYSKLKKYVLSYEEFMRRVEYVYQKKRRVLLLQSGENRSQTYIDFVSKCVGAAKKKFRDLTIILCLGNLNYKQYRQLKEAGAKRYILKFETSNPRLYRQIKPSDSLQKRLACLHMLEDLEFDIGSGNMIGLPNQTRKDIIDDLFFLGKFKLKMASTSIFIPGEESNYRDKHTGDLMTTLNFMALMRIMYPQVLIPTTSSLEKIKKNAQYLGLMAGANTVTIHDGTPSKLKKQFPIYSVRRVTPDEKHIRHIVRKAHLKMRTGPLIEP